jgi:hypothetical protein
MDGPQTGWSKVPYPSGENVNIKLLWLVGFAKSHFLLFYYVQANVDSI